MRIEKIELIGFKSFADRTSFALHRGITCIVGPNGCGKSNIVDAFRWVLGEQSAKSLRGDKMEEVIFNGSASKKPKGMAEVSIMISGMNGSSQNNGSGEGDTVTVSRRLYRSGESEYMLNKTQCRLKDIRDIFLDTGLDMRSYSILEQGRIGEILNSKPLDRRFIIEEVAGVMKYKVRKAEALSKLDASRTNLLRINDIVAELRKQINILDRLAKKAERYKKLSAEMHAIELRIARREYQKIGESYELILSEHGSLKEKEASMKAELTGVENRTETRRIALLEKEKELERIQNAFQAMERDISDIEREIAVARNDIGNLRELQGRFSQQQEELTLRSSETAVRCEDLRQQITKISDEMAAYGETLREKSSVLGSMEEELAEKEDLTENSRREVFRLTEELSGIRNELGRQQTTFESYERRAAGTARESEEARKVLGELESAISTAETEIYARNNEMLLLKERKEGLLAELAAAREVLGSVTGTLSQTREELASCASRLDSLKEIVFDEPTRDLLSSAEGITLIASVSDIMEVHPDYEKAVESALFEKADAFIFESLAEVRQAILSLKGKDVGKTAFIPLSARRLDRHSGKLPQGVTGAASDFVKVKEPYAWIAGNLLGGVLIVEDLQTAFRVRESDGQHLLVTPEGEIVEPSGAVVTGEGRGIFRRKREMREMEELISDKRAAAERLQAELENIRQVIAGREDEIRGVETSVHTLEKEVSLAKLTVGNYQEDKERTSRKLAYLTVEHEEISRERENLGSLMAANEIQARALEEKKTGIEQDTAALLEGISRKKAEIEAQRSEVTDFRLLIASGRERTDAFRNELESSSQMIGELEQKKVSLFAEAEGVVTRIAQRESDIAGHEERLRQMVADADRVRQEISGKKEEIERENEDLLAVEQGLRNLRREISGVTSRMGELDIGKTEHKMRLENLAANVSTNYGISIGEVELTEILPEEEERLAELRTKIQEIGPVNLGTLDEYEELRTRYEFLTRQQEDLHKSIAELEEAITKINSTTRKKLRDAYDALKVKFAEVFTQLFGGGRAELVLTDEHNILETGIDIIAQPPGKKLQNIHLLSGGEKALTALSLQFASFLIKPTPMCILDEADAPLDESNTDRFSRMLADLSLDTQFIVVTHNKTTMSVAQHLYGITMEEAGVSRVISMQLAEA